MTTFTDRLRDARPDLIDTWDETDLVWGVKQISGLRVAVMPLAFTSAIIIGRPHWVGYEDRWCYHNTDAALAAAQLWDGPWPGTEPAGWHRHPATGRRREGGDPATEYVAP